MQHPRALDILAAVTLWIFAIILVVLALVSAGHDPTWPEKIGNGILFVFAAFLAVLGRSALK